MNIVRLVFFALVIGSTAVSHSATIKVPSDLPSIQDAIDAAVDSDTILVSPGTYTENAVINGKYVVLLGDSSSQSVILTSGTANLPVLHWRGVMTASAQVVGFVIEGAIDAPGVLCDSSEVTVRKNTIRSNSSSGIRVMGAVTATIEDNLIAGNSAAAGGGIALDEGAADVRRNQIIGNQADLGGGIFSDNRSALVRMAAGVVAPDFVIEGNVIAGNRAFLGGGGIYLYEGFPVTVIGNLFVDDTSEFGGGIDNSGRYDVVVRGNTFDKCIGGSGGGNAIWWANNADVGGVIKNNVFTNCVSIPGTGGAVGCDPNIVGTVELDYNVTWNNLPADYYRFLPGSHAILSDPLFCNPFGGDYTVVAGSVCIANGEGGENIGAFGSGCTSIGSLVTYLIALGEQSLHLLDHTPLFTWGFAGEGGAPQVEYELEVGSDNEWTSAEFWSSGTVASNSTSIEYSGTPLVDGQVFYTRIRINDGANWTPWLARQFRMNTPPEAPLNQVPLEGQIRQSGTVFLEVSAGPDAEGDQQQFEFQVFADAGLATIAASRDFSTAPYWYVSPSLTTDQSYWWRARSKDSWEIGGWSQATSFVLDRTNEPPDAFELLSPAQGAIVLDLTPLFDWESATDPDPSDAISSYTFVLATDSSFSFAATFSGLTPSQHVSTQLPYGQRYWWKVAAYDSRGGQRQSGVATFIIPAPGDVDADGRFTVADVVGLIDIVFRGAPEPAGLLAADVNGDCLLDILDVVSLIDYIFRAGPVPTSVCDTPQQSGRKLLVPQAYSTIQEAVNVALDGDTVCVASGLYSENVTITNLDVVLLGDTVAYSVILQPTGVGFSPLVFDGVSSIMAQLVGFVVSGAEGAPAVRCMNSSPTIRRNRIEDNLNAGVVFEGEGHGLIADNLIARNLGGYGGGVYLEGASADVMRNIFEQNRAYIGGGLCGNGESPHIIADNVFRGNYASGGGGGVYLINEGRVLISTNLFVDDTSDHGGGMDNSGRDSVTVINNTFDRCISGLAFGGGNAIWWADSGDVACVIKNNIVTNSTSLNGLGGAIGGDQGVVSFVQLGFNAFWNNSPADNYRFSPGPGYLVANPLFCNPTLEDYRLGPGSPCLNSGEGGVDRGAFGSGCGP